MKAPLSLSPEFVASASAEQQALLACWEERRAEHERYQALADEAARQAEQYAQTIRELGEILGVENQLSIVSLSDELRGERLRQVAADVIWRHFRTGEVVHY